jgi:hypothetical protein
MRKLFFCILAVSFSAFLLADVITCHDVQYTTLSSGASPLAGTVVTVEGIVVSELFYTGTNTNNYGFMIADTDGGAWSGLLIFSNQFHPQRGDKVQCTGTITEYYEFTEMSPTTAVQTVSQGNAIPAPAVIETSQLASAATAEQWESCFVRVEDVNVTSTPTSYNEWMVTDGSGAAQIDDQCFPRSGFTWPTITVGQNWARIQGVVDYSFNYFGLNPRDLTDLVLIDSVANASVRIQTTTAEINTQTSVNVLTSRIKPQWGVSSYTAQIQFDPNKVTFNGLDYQETMSVFMPDYEVSDEGNVVTITYQSQEPVTSSDDDMTLIKLLFTPITYGESVIQILSFAYDTTPILGTSNGKILTAIQQDIAWLNITNPTTASNVFNPFLNEHLTLEYGCKNSSTGINVKAIVRIYDSQGRLVATPVNKNISNALGIESTLWDGRDANMLRLPVGLYYCSLEVISRATGAKQTTVQPIVIKTTLK